MKKTTKILLVLAAVVAMTIGAVSTVMAADYPVVGTWTEEEPNVWTAKDTEGNDLKDTWAKNEAGHWFYFDGKYALVDEFKKENGNLYYFGKDAIMCQGWVEFTEDNEDLEVIEDTLRYNQGYVLDGDKYNAYGESVWYYFGEGGVAAEDEWVEDCQMYYYFDGYVMVCNDYAFEIDDEIYGFSGDGNMHVGWVKLQSVHAGKNWTAPTEKNDTEAAYGYVYYNTDGTIAEEGWFKEGSDWCYFVTVEDGRFVDQFGLIEGVSTVALTNVYVTEGLDDDDNNFYFDEKACLVKGQKEFKKVSLGLDQFFAPLGTSATDSCKQAVTEVNAKVYFDKATGAQKFGMVDDSFYMMANAAGYNSNGKVKGYAYAISDKDWYTRDDNRIDFDLQKVYTDYTKNGVDVEGVMIKDVILKYTTDNKNYSYYYYDADGKLVEDTLMDLYDLTIGIADGGKIVAGTGSTTAKIGSRRYNFNEEFGVLKVAGATVACGASTKAVKKYELTVAYDEESVNAELYAAIADDINGKYNAGETVEFSIPKQTYLKITEMAGLGISGKKYDGNSSGTHGYKASFVMPENDVELTFNFDAVYKVSYNGTTTSYAVGEQVIVTAKDGYRWVAEGAAPKVTGEGITVAYYAKSGDYANFTKIKFNMPAANVAISDYTEVIYDVKLASGSEGEIKTTVAGVKTKVSKAAVGDAIEVTPKSGKGFYGDTDKATFTENNVEYALTLTTNTDNKIAFEMINKAITVTAVATATPSKFAVAIVTDAAVTVKVGTTDIASGDAVKVAETIVIECATVGKVLDTVTYTYNGGTSTCTIVGGKASIKMPAGAITITVTTKAE